MIEMSDDETNGSVNFNSPSSLLLLCVRKVVLVGVNITDVALPQELANLIIEVSRTMCALST